MENITKVTIRGNRKVVSELAHRGQKPAQEAYQPEHLGRISKEDTEAIYMSNKRYLQAKSDARKEEIWNQILENRKLLKDIVLIPRHSGNRVIRPLPQQVSMFTKSINSVNRIINSIFDHQSTPYSQIKQMQLV